MTNRGGGATQGRRLGWKELLLSLFLIISAWAGERLFSGDTLGVKTRVVVESEGQVQVLFTAPEDDARQGGVDESLVALVDGAQESVDVAAYDFELESVAEALARAVQRDVRVRLVTDTDYQDEAGVVMARAAGIPVVTDDVKPFMHDKFVIIDGRWVWTGSWNLTENGTYRNNNNVVLVDSPALAENYTAEFEELFAERAFGAASPDTAPHPEVEVGDILVENYFAPEADIQGRIVELLDGAESEIRFMAFVFTDNELSKALNQRLRAGVTVQGVVEARNVGATGSDVAALQQAGVDLLVDGNPYTMHHKVIIVDEAIVITGSYNFTRSAAEFNDENVLIIHSPEIAQLYLEEFGRVYQQAKEAQ